ncbi:hypothetical protein NU219Hw_g4722t1 [Hortaea werneckii]
MISSLLLLACSALVSGQHHFWGHHGDGHGRGDDHKWGRHGWHFVPGRDWQDVPSSGNTTFSQLIDHNNPDLGTFEQFYYYDTTYWKGPGSPVILFTPGEVNATGYTSYLTTNRTTGVVAEKIGAAAVVLEHRYWGTSSPFTELTTANMSYLTLENSIHDMTYFANNVKLPFTKHHSNADDVPWVFMGGSYSGALSAWIESVDPGTIWAYQASSAVVQTISDFWAYFLPVQQGMPQNCSADVSLVIDHMDDVLTNGSENEIHDLKTMFGLQNVTHNDDFMAALENGPWLWQGNQFYTGYSGFFQWCDYIENMINATDTTIRPGPEGVGLEKALAGYAEWTKSVLLPGYCEDYGYDVFNGSLNTYCFDTYDPTSPIFTDTTLANEANRQWQWMLCNEPFGYWQDGAPRDRPSIVSRLFTPEYWTRQCALYFPPGPGGETYGLAQGRDEDDVNAYTGGWDIENPVRLVYANGGFDPWREATVSAEMRPGGPLRSTEEVPVLVVPGGFHTSDLVTRNGEVNEGCQKVIDEEVRQIAEWVAEFPKRRRWSA